MAANPMFPFGNLPLAEADPVVADLVEKEKNRQWRGLELIASEVRTLDLLSSRAEIVSFGRI
jgi:hypothetical protein